jgi:quinoprotein glucose dehydrogenase
MLLGPPWSTRTAYDLNTGTIMWQIPVGDAIGGGLEPGNNFGDGMYHGPKSTLAVTAGGLGFAGTRDRKLRAYDKDTGKVLWSTDLPAPSQGAPAVYDVDGREYVVVFANGGYYAYALPRASK